MNFCVLETILNNLLINLKFFESGLDCKTVFLYALCM